MLRFISVRIGLIRRVDKALVRAINIKENNATFLFLLSVYKSYNLGNIASRRASSSNYLHKCSRNFKKEACTQPITEACIAHIRRQYLTRSAVNPKSLNAL